ncbi:hypothetical protein [Weissella confusa]|uniref:hypothetical protein n=1 Tax=Weissella confusa TaxID=1583 RepID=UPI00223BCE9D|nr:hypothetical protein [Weissella confusa]MCS9991189.1 hypothetical protein [Weissella confusa]
MNKTMTKVIKDKAVKGMPILQTMHMDKFGKSVTNRHVLIAERFKEDYQPEMTGEINMHYNGYHMNGNYPEVDRLIPADTNATWTIRYSDFEMVVKAMKKEKMLEFTMNENSDILLNDLKIGTTDREFETTYVDPKYLLWLLEYAAEIVDKNTDITINWKNPFEPLSAVFDTEQMTSTFLLTPVRTY